MRLRVVLSDRASCHASLHSDDSARLFDSGDCGNVAGQWCRALRVDHLDGVRNEPCFVGWAGGPALERGTLLVSKPMADCVGLGDGDLVEVTAVRDAPKSPSVMVQPATTDDWEVIELHAGYIEENMLSQVAVLAPGMSFPVWVHGQMPVKLRVDARDENRSECFVLSRDTELLVECKDRQRVQGGIPQRLFAAVDADGSLDDDALSIRVRARILSMDDGIPGPAGRMHPLDLQMLARYQPRDGCAVWVEVRGQPPALDGTAAAEDRPAARPPPSWQLLRAASDLDVPRGQIVVGKCWALYNSVPLFAMVGLARCRQVPVYVPELQLVPMLPAGGSVRSLDSWRRAVIGRFRDFVAEAGEVSLADGAVVRLWLGRGGSQPAHEGSKLRGVGTTPAGEGRNRQYGRDGPCGTVSEATSSTTDLYEGLSDISDIYVGGGSGAPMEGGDPGWGVVELDLGLDIALEQDDASHGPQLGHACEERPEVVDVVVRFALGQVRSSRVAGHGGTQRPPFVRLTPQQLDAGDVHVVLAEQAGIAVDAVDPDAALRALWQATPGVAALPPGDLGVAAIELVPPAAGDATAHGIQKPVGVNADWDNLEFLSAPLNELEEQLLSQIGCPSGPRQQKRELPAGGPPVRRLPGDPHNPTLPPQCVPGAAAVTGPAGCGKTMLSRQALARLSALGVAAIQVSCASLGTPGRKFSVAQRALHDVLRFACFHAPSAVLLDDLGALCPHVEQGAPNQSVVEDRAPIVAELLLDLVRALRGTGARVALCATLPGDTAAHRLLWQPPLLEHKVAVPSPRLKERPGIFQAILCRLGDTVGAPCADETLLAPGVLDDWAGRLDGFSVADLAALASRARGEAQEDAARAQLAPEGTGPGALCLAAATTCTAQHLDAALRGYVPTGMADQTFLSSDSGMDEVGGLGSPKRELMDMLTMPTRYAVLVDRAPVRTCRGLMLVGPPGCGKTLLVRAAAFETKGLLRFLSVKGPELLSKYIGESEAGVRRVFERAAAAAPSVIFFDEIEALAPQRGGDSTGVTDRVVNQMLCYLDGVEDRGSVYVIGATSRPDLVDAALMRPGRFDRLCYCGLPDAAERLDLCTKLAKRHNVEANDSIAVQPPGAADELEAEVRTLADSMPSLFSGADIAGLFSSARVAAVGEAVAGRAGVASTVAVTMRHLREALRTAKPSISTADNRKHEVLFKPYRLGAKGSALDRTGTEAVAGSAVALA